MHDRLLFILKQRETYAGAYSGSLSSGLRNSVEFVLTMLASIGIEAAMVEVDDNNAIDAAVTAWRPTHVIIEAFWVVPEKFDELLPLHPGVSWIVRNHSEIPFLANEGIAFGWIAGYLQRGVEIMCNAPRALADLRAVAQAYGTSDRLVTFGPNSYPLPCQRDAITTNACDPDTLVVGCFGAIRPLKNTMAQALAAIAAAQARRRCLEFHVNVTRLEGNGDPILKNLRQMFAALPRHRLVEHDWLPHSAFCKLVAGMDIVSQVSFSETFNIVAADAVAANVAVVVSNEVPWIGDYAHADPCGIPSITQAMLRICDEPDRASRLHRQRRDLAHYCRGTERVWEERFTRSWA